MEIKTPELSQTEPSTPVHRAVSPERGSHSVPWRRSIQLPPSVMPGILAQLSQDSDSRPARARSTSRNTGGERSRSRSRHKSMSPRDTPIRRGRGRETERGRENLDDTPGRRRRRSSIITTLDGQTVFDPKYVGAVTVDYLRFFCQVLMEERQKTGEREEANSERERRDESNTTGLNPTSQSEDSAVEPRNEFDHSLQIPSDSEVLHSPISARELVKSPILSIFQPESPTTNIYAAPLPTPSVPQPGIQPAKQPFKSYLERILEKQRQKKGKTVQSPVLHAAESDIETPTEDQLTKFVIDPKFSATPVNDENQEPEYDGSSDIGPVELDIDVNQSSELDFRMDPVFETEEEEAEPEPLLNVRDSVVITNQREDVNRTPEYSFDHGFDTYSPNKLVTPATSEFNYSYDRAVNSEVSTSPEGVIHEQYTLNHEDSEAILEQVAESAPDEWGVAEPLLITEHRRPSIEQPRIKRIKDTPIKFSGSSDIPIRMIKGLVNTARLHGFISGPPTKKKKLDRITTTTQDQIRQFSEEFLQSVVSDLEAYAGHRGSQEIGLSDVILYMNRLKGIEQRNESEVENISKLAQSFLPLELLISLDNSLSESLHRK